MGEIFDKCIEKIRANSQFGRKKNNKASLVKDGQRESQLDFSYFNYLHEALEEVLAAGAVGVVNFPSWGPLTEPVHIANIKNIWLFFLHTKDTLSMYLMFVLFYTKQES
jgi:hypothetical protein